MISFATFATRLRIGCLYRLFVEITALELVSDRLWVEKALAGDQQAFGELVNLHQHAVYNLAYRCWANAEKPKTRPRKRSCALMRTSAVTTRIARFARGCYPSPQI